MGVVKTLCGVPHDDVVKSVASVLVTLTKNGLRCPLRLLTRRRSRREAGDALLCGHAGLSRRAHGVAK
jgi:hypothetical protein